MNIFISKTAEFSYDIYIGSSKTDPEKIYVDVDDILLKEIAGDDLKELVKHKITCKVPRYEDTVQIAKSVISLSNNDFNVNPADVNLNRMTVLIKRWDLTGEESAPSPQDIKDLNPFVASVIYYGLDKELSRLGLA